MEKLTVRKPTLFDVQDAVTDLATMRCAPPLVLSVVLLVFVTGSVLIALITAGLTSFVHALWSRLVDGDDDDEKRAAP